MNPNPDEHFPGIRKLNNTQLTYGIVRSAAIRGDSGLIVTPAGVRPARMRVSLGVASAEMPSQKEIVTTPNPEPCAE